jgi:hypothetical protein
MKKSLVILCAIILWMQSFATEIIGSVNYISCGYYIKVAEAEHAYLKGEKKLVYDTLQKTEKTIPLINEKEMLWFVELSLFYNNYPKAYEYIYKLIDNHGYKISDFERLENFQKLKKKKFYDANVLIQSEKNFVADTVLWQQLNKMIEYDQSARVLMGNDCYKKDRDSLCCLYYIEQLNYIDSVNYYQLLDIIEKKGFPSSKNIKYSLLQRQDVEWALGTLIIHMANTPSYVEKMKSILLNCVKKGDCHPSFIAMLIDKQCLIYRQPCIYGYLCDDPVDLPNLDKRRTEIGLPSRKLLCETLRFKSISPELLKTLPENVQEAVKAPCIF